MKLVETQVRIETKNTYKYICAYCNEKKNFLMLKPAIFYNNGYLEVPVNVTDKQNWICLKCLESDIDAMGHSVDITEYE